MSVEFNITSKLRVISDYVEQLTDNVTVYTMYNDLYLNDLTTKYKGYKVICENTILMVREQEGERYIDLVNEFGNIVNSYLIASKK